MSASIQDKVKAELQEAKTFGQLRADRIRAIIKNAVSQSYRELKEGSDELRTIIRDVFSMIMDSLQERGGEAKEEVSALIEGSIEVTRQRREQVIDTLNAEIQRLQSQVESEEEAL